MHDLASQLAEAFEVRLQIALWLSLSPLSPPPHLKTGKPEQPLLWEELALLRCCVVPLRNIPSFPPSFSLPPPPPTEKPFFLLIRSA